jgi:ectoine hydroxylase-related dioxygenase (phytanoyl-CoA dioxygenase family)
MIIHTHQIQSWSAAWARFCFHTGFLDTLSSLIGEDIILHHSKLFEKPPGNGAPFPPHQDWSYFPCSGAAMLAAVVTMSDADESNGCIRVWPGSHRHGRIDQRASKQGLHGFDQRFPMADSIPCCTKAGDIIIFSDTTVHASLPNRGSLPRKSVLFQMHSGSDELDNGQAHPYAQLVLRGWNHRMERDKAR